MYYVTTGMSHKWAPLITCGGCTRGIGLRIGNANYACLVLRFENGFLFSKKKKKKK